MLSKTLLNFNLTLSCVLSRGKYFMLNHRRIDAFFLLVRNVKLYLLAGSCEVLYFIHLFLSLWRATCNYVLLKDLLLRYLLRIEARLL